MTVICMTVQLVTAAQQMCTCSRVRYDDYDDDDEVEVCSLVDDNVTCQTVSPGTGDTCSYPLAVMPTTANYLYGAAPRKLHNCEVIW